MPWPREAYHHLQASAPEAVRPEYAWLYCRAAQEHRLTDAHAGAVRPHLRRRRARPRVLTRAQWDFEEVEYAYLERAAAQAPGHFPAPLGPEYAAHGEEMLKDRVAHLEEAKQAEAALAAAEVWQKLAPASPRAHDCLAELYYRARRPGPGAADAAGLEPLDPSAHCRWCARPSSISRPATSAAAPT